MGIERVGISDAIIAGIAGGGTALEQMAAVQRRLGEAGFAIVPTRSSRAMMKAGLEWKITTRGDDWDATEVTNIYYAMMRAADE